LNPVITKEDNIVSPTAQKRQSGLQKPYFISDRHFRYLLNRMARGTRKDQLKQWISSYFRASFSCQCGELTGKVSPETPTPKPGGKNGNKIFDDSQFPTSLKQQQRDISQTIFLYNEFIFMNQVVVLSDYFAVSPTYAPCLFFLFFFDHNKI
jgi:hypothetical protein